MIIQLISQKSRIEACHPLNTQCKFVKVQRKEKIKNQFKGTTESNRKYVHKQEQAIGEICEVVTQHIAIQRLFWYRYGCSSNYYSKLYSTNIDDESYISTHTTASYIY